MLPKVRNFLFGKPRDFFDKATRKNISLVAFLAWVGLGADGISSACYGPEEGFVALGIHGELAIFLAIATALTIFIISYAYTQVIELFPNGGGGYRVATRLLGRHAGLVSGSALIVDYVLTISISIASAIDAIFSFIPEAFHDAKLLLATVLIVLLAFLNLRGMKESIKFLLPIFLGFMITHLVLIIYGIASHHYGISELMPKAVSETKEMSSVFGWVFVFSIFLKAFSMGAGTFTGLEAVSNNVNTLSEPRVRTAKITMFLVATSLAFMAGGIILLYLLWDVSRVEGQTLNATTFYILTQTWNYGEMEFGKFIVPIVLLFEAGLLLVAANSGFLAGPVVASNMANDGWMPKSFSSLSSRLVVKNGVVFMAIAAIVTLLITGGSVHVLVVLYSINVFITFSMSLLGLSIYWLRHRKRKPTWKRKLLISGVGFVVCGSILLITIFEKFYEGGWVTLLITSVFVAIGLWVQNTYKRFRIALENKELEFYQYGMVSEINTLEPIDKKAPTAAIIVDQTFGSGIHCLLEIKKIFPGIFQNFIFVTVGEVDSNTFHEERKWREMRNKTKNMLRKCKNYCNANGKSAKAYVAYGTDVVEKMSELTLRVSKDYSNVVFFGTKFTFDNENILTQMLFNHISYIMQRRLHVRGANMVILPMRINPSPQAIKLLSFSSSVLKGS